MRPPNIVFVLADDLGFADTGVTGSRYYRTPAIDRLAAEGVRFTRWRVCPNCAPTRAALLTGQVGARTGVYTVGSIDRFDWRSRPLRPVDNVESLPLDRKTVADTLRDAGYATGIFGKWHLGDDPAHHPSRRGFDEALSVSTSGHFGFTTDPPADVPKGRYLADFLTDQAEAFVRRHRDRPFFLYLPHFAVHAPHQAPEEDVARFRDLPPAGGHRDPVYAAMIAALDRSVARLRACLEREGIADRTVVVFSSDNGGVGGYAREGIRSREVTDNAPLRGGKGTLYEGGTRVPFVACWPGVTRPGSLCHTPAQHVDLLPTLAEIAGARLPRQPRDGVSLVPELRRPDRRRAPRPIVQHFPGYLGGDGPGQWRTTPVGTIEFDGWKLFEFFEDGRRELYHLTDDPGERDDLAARRPEIVRDLQRRMDAWRRAVNAPMPTPNPRPPERRP